MSNRRLSQHKTTAVAAVAAIIALTVGAWIGSGAFAANGEANNANSAAVTFSDVGCDENGLVSGTITFPAGSGIFVVFLADNVPPENDFLPILDIGAYQQVEPTAEQTSAAFLLDPSGARDDATTMRVETSLNADLEGDNAFTHSDSFALCGHASISTKTPQVTKTAQVTKTVQATKTPQATGTAHATQTVQTTRTAVPTVTRTQEATSTAQPTSTSTVPRLTTAATPSSTSTPRTAATAAPRTPSSTPTHASGVAAAATGPSSGPTMALPNTGVAGDAGRTQHLLIALVSMLSAGGIATLLVGLRRKSL